MLKITLPFTAAFLLLCNTAYAQHKLTGTITDPNGKPLEFATLVIETKVEAGKALKHPKFIQTDLKGAYRFESLKPEHYKVIADYVGYESLSFEYRQPLRDTVINLQFKPASKELNEVVISASKPIYERKIDRTVFNVGSSMAALGGDGLEALKKAPGVQVKEGSETSIDLIGKGSVQVMVNDRMLDLGGDDLIAYLKGLSANDIERIEVITNPPAKYEAAGNSGLINIVLKKSTVLGYSGSIRTSYTQKTKASTQNGGNILYNQGKFRTTARLNTGTWKSQGESNSSILFNNDSEEQGYQSEFSNRWLGGAIGVDFQASENTLFGVAYNGSTYNWSPQGNTRVIGLDANGSQTHSMLSSNNGDNNGNNGSANLHFQHTLDTSGKKISTDLDWFMRNGSRQSTFDSKKIYQDGISPKEEILRKSSGFQNSESYAMRVDLELPFKWARFDAGSRASFVTNKSDGKSIDYSDFHSLYILNPAQSSFFRYTENTQAAYITASKSLGKWSFKLGLRGELWQTEGHSVTIDSLTNNSFAKLLPTGFVNYVPNEKHTFGITFGKRIERPGYWSLDPFKNYSTANSYWQGNPYLQPSYSDNVEFTHTYSRLLTTTLSYSRTTNGGMYMNVMFLEEDAAGNRIQAYRRFNFLTDNQYQLGHSVVLNPTKRWESTNQVYVNYRENASTMAEALVPSPKSWGGNISSRNSISINSAKSIMGSLDASYYLAENGGSYSFGPRHSLDFGMRFLLMNKKLELGIVASDLTVGRSSYTSYANGATVTESSYYDNASVRASINYKFGNDKLNERQRKANEEQKRAN